MHPFLMSRKDICRIYYCGQKPCVAQLSMQLHFKYLSSLAEVEFFFISLLALAASSCWFICLCLSNNLPPLKEKKYN